MGDSPADGQIGVFRIPGEPELVVDIMSNVYGIPFHQLDRLKNRALRIEGIRVMDPVLLFQSKCHCLVGLDQTGRQDERHVRMLSCILPAHLEGLVDQATAGYLTERSLINELKLLRKVLTLSQVARAMELLQIGLISFFPADRLRRCGLEKVQQFALSSLG